MTASLWMHRQLTHQATFVLKPLTILIPAQIKSFESDGGWKRFHPGWTCLVFTGMLWCCVASTVLVPQLSTSFTEGADSMSLTGLIWVERCAEIKTAALVTQQVTDSTQAYCSCNGPTPHCNWPTPHCNWPTPHCNWPTPHKPIAVVTGSTL